jgi:hypothetical protein
MPDFFRYFKWAKASPDLAGQILSREEEDDQRLREQFGGKPVPPSVTPLAMVTAPVQAAGGGSQDEDGGDVENAEGVEEEEEEEEEEKSEKDKQRKGEKSLGNEATPQVAQPAAGEAHKSSRIPGKPIADWPERRPTLEELLALHNRRPDGVLTPEFDGKGKERPYWDERRLDRSALENDEMVPS